jgi:sulfatase maturation enzyme AslB (radical SAM superfamily)
MQRGDGNANGKIPGQERQVRRLCEYYSPRSVDVTAVDVVIQGGEVTVSGEGFDRAAVAHKLGQLGYPEGA